MQYRVISIRELPGEISEVIVKPIDNDYIDFAAGQYVYLEVSPALRLPFSIANAPSMDRHLEFYIRHVPSDPQNMALINHLYEIKSIVIEGPFGNCVYTTDSAKPILMVAGGMGITQLKALIEQAIHSQDKRKIHLYWSVNSAISIFKPEWPIQWLTQLNHFEYTLLLSQKNADSWPGRIGRLDTIITHDYPDLSGQQIYVSGPWDLVDNLLENFLKRGLDRDLIYSDRFAFL